MPAPSSWTQNLQIDLGLVEVRDNVDEHWTMRALAGASVGVDPEDALTAASELSRAVNGLLAAMPVAKSELVTILGSPGNDYQRCLWYNLAGRDPLGTAVDLGRLVGLLTARAHLAREAAVTGSGVAVAPDPYVSDCADGPLGAYSADFMLGSQWMGFAPIPQG